MTNTLPALPSVESMAADAYAHPFSPPHRAAWQAWARDIVARPPAEVAAERGWGVNMTPVVQKVIGQILDGIDGAVAA